MAADPVLSKADFSLKVEYEENIGWYPGGSSECWECDLGKKEVRAFVGGHLDAAMLENHWSNWTCSLTSVPFHGLETYLTT